MSKGGHFPKVKICGIADPGSLQEIVKLGIDAVGFVFYSASPRAVTGAQVKGLVEFVPPFVHTVGVFVDEKPAHVKKVCESCSLSYIQLHGAETPEYCEAFPKNRLIKAFRVKPGFDPETVRKYLPRVAAILIDSAESGIEFDWDVARRVRQIAADVPLILAGGLTADNVEEAVRAVQPYAIDVSSGVETAPGVKNAAKVQELLQRLSSLFGPSALSQISA
ncbi:phosphoribosylanthranilate isomerase [bacterium]|nr:phosphoribosylanthranilate isomerase [bacterium]